MKRLLPKTVERHAMSFTAINCEQLRLSQFNVCFKFVLANGTTEHWQ